MDHFAGALVPAPTSSFRLDVRSREMLSPGARGVICGTTPTSEGVSERELLDPGNREC
jgi:hypothetical protein